MILTSWSTKSKVAIALATFVVAGAAGTITANARTVSEFEIPAGQGELPSTKFHVPVGTNPDGLTYGSGLDRFYDRKPYDLISVVGDSGKLGFVDRVRFESIGDEVPPDEAAAFRKRVDAGEVAIPVFETDGKTQIDTFTVGPSKMPGLKKYSSSDGDQTPE